MGMRPAPDCLRAVLAVALMISPACRHAGVAAGEDAGAGAGDADASDKAGGSDADVAEATAALGCGCPPGEYWIEVKSDTGSPVIIDELLRAPYVQQPVNPTC